MASVMFNEDGQPVQAGDTWLVMAESSQAEPEISEDEAISIGRDEAVSVGLAHKALNPSLG
jgi:hypothetical protein